MKTRTFLTLALAALLALSAAIWFFQAAVFTELLRRARLGAHAENAGGTIFSGLTFYGVEADRPSFHFTARELYLRADVGTLLTGRFVLAEVKAFSPEVIIKKSAPRPAAGPPSVPFPIREILISSGSVKYAGYALSVPDCSLSASGGTFVVIACRAGYKGTSASFAGKYAGGDVSLNGQASWPARRLRASFTYAMRHNGHELSARGTASGAPFSLKGKLNGSFWSASVGLKRSLPLGSLRPSLRPIPVASADISATGRLPVGGTFRASGKFSAEDGRGGRAYGTFSSSPGYSALRAAFTYAELSGETTAQIRKGYISGSFRAAGSGNFTLPSGEEFTVEQGTASCSLGGRLSEPLADCGIGARRFSLGRFAAGTSVFSGGVRFVKPPRFNFSAFLSTPSFGGISIDSASFSAAGSAASGVLSLNASYKGDAARLTAAYSLKEDSRALAFDSLSFSRLPAWRLCSPAAVEFRNGKAYVPGACFASDGGRIRLSGVFGGGFPEALHLAVTDFDLAELSRAGVPRRLAGRLDLAADYDATDPSRSAFSVKADKLRLEELDLGSFSAGGSFGPGRLVLENSLWRLYGGTARASGRVSFPVRAGGADFTVIASSMNAAPLLALAPGVSAKEVWINGETRLRIEGGTIRNSGSLRLASPSLEIRNLGLRLSEVTVLAESGGLSQLYVSASARGKKNEMVTMSGPLSAKGPELRLRTRRLSLDHPAGLTGQVKADLLFSGAWKEPELSGAVEFRKAVFEFDKWKKYRPPQTGGTGEYYGRMSLDLDLSAERNIWYREGPSSIELKGRVFVKKEHYRPAALIGTVEAVKGYYIYLGNSFAIQSARLTFNGETPPNPALAVSAAIEEHGRPLKIYFNATGTAREPQVALTSDPPMDQRDIMSVLVTGRPLYQSALAPGAAQPAPGSVTAQNIAAGYLSQQASTTFGRKLDLDVFNVRVNAENIPDVTLGRYITRELFVSYGQALGQGGERRVSAEYTLTRHLSLVGNNSSEGRYGADLLFKYGIK